MKCPTTYQEIPNDAPRTPARAGREATIQCPHCRAPHPLAGQAPSLPYRESPNVTYTVGPCGDVWVDDHGRRRSYGTPSGWRNSSAARRWRNPLPEGRHVREVLAMIGREKW